MINANLEQFLDTGWFNETTLYLNGYTYWCEGYWKTDNPNIMYFFVLKYKSKLIDNMYTERVSSDGKYDVEKILEISGKDENEVKVNFLKAKIFDGKSFWEVENEIAIYDEI